MPSTVQLPYQTSPHRCRLCIGLLFLITTTDEYSIFRLYLRPTPDFIHELLTYDNRIEILKPEYLRAQIKETLKEMMAIYE
ncbi:MAG: WYL domain-containing protein [Bacteroidales bacterium]|nr:WYL domain-containing protein [Bacteroidales bacterium]